MSLLFVRLFSPPCFAGQVWFVFVVVVFFPLFLFFIVGFVVFVCFFFGGGSLRGTCIYMWS